MVFGVTSAGKVVGQQVTDRTLEELAQEFQGFEPPVMLSIERIDLDGLTPEMLFQPNESTPWNPWIASVFYRRGLIETWGRGTLKIASKMQDAGLQPPAIVENAGFVIMTFVMPDRRTSEKMSPSPSAVLAAPATCPSNGALAYESRRWPACQVRTSPKNVERSLKQLRNAGRIEFVGSS